MGINFDPGYAQYTTILSISVESIYASISRFKNLNQKKMQFRMYYPKIKKMVDNNVAFCFGCILWAVYIKSLGSEEILNNPCLNDIYNEEEAIEEIIYSKNYFEQLKKDAKYYLGEKYSYDEKYINILNAYQEFLTLNESFVKTKTTDDLKIPETIKQPTNLLEIKDKIDEVVKTGILTDLFTLYDTIL